MQPARRKPSPAQRTIRRIRGTPSPSADTTAATPAAQATLQPLVAAIVTDQQTQVPSAPQNSGASTQIGSVAAAGTASTPGSNSTAGTDATAGPNTSADINAQASVNAAVGNTTAQPALPSTDANPTPTPKNAKPVAAPNDTNPAPASLASQATTGKNAGKSNLAQPDATKNDAATQDSTNPQSSASVVSTPASSSAPSQTAAAPAAHSQAVPDPNATAGRAGDTSRHQFRECEHQCSSRSIASRYKHIREYRHAGRRNCGKIQRRHQALRHPLGSPELGRVEVRLSIGDDGKTQASLLVDKPQTLELLQRDAPNLHRALSNAGLDLSNNGLNFSLRGQDRQNDGGSVAKGRSRSLSVKAVVNTDAVSTSGSTDNYAPGGARLDIRV